MASRSVTSAVISIIGSEPAARTLAIFRDVSSLLAMFLQPAIPVRFLRHQRPADAHQAGLRVRARCSITPGLCRPARR
jgi:hypothetical protein